MQPKQKNITEIVKLANQLAALETSEFEFEIYAVPEAKAITISPPLPLPLMGLILLINTVDSKF